MIKNNKRERDWIDLDDDVDETPKLKLEKVTVFDCIDLCSSPEEQVNAYPQLKNQKVDSEVEDARVQVFYDLLVSIHPITTKKDPGVGVEYLAFGTVIANLNLSTDDDEVYGAALENPCIKSGQMVRKVVREIARIAQNHKDTETLNHGGHFASLKVNKGTHWVRFLLFAFDLVSNCLFALQLNLAGSCAVQDVRGGSNVKKLTLLHSAAYSVQLESKKTKSKTVYSVKLGFPFYASDISVSNRIDQQLKLHHALMNNQIEVKTLLDLTDERLMAMIRTLKSKDNARYAWTSGHEDVLRRVLGHSDMEKVTF